MKRLVNILSRFEERLTFNVCCSIRHRLREIAMSNFAFGVPVRGNGWETDWVRNTLGSEFNFMEPGTQLKWARSPCLLP